MADGFQMVPELVAQNAPQDIFRLRRARLGVDPVKGALEHNDLPDAGIDLVLPQGIEIVPSGVLRDLRRRRHDHAAGELPEKLLGQLVEQLRDDSFVFL